MSKVMVSVICTNFNKGSWISDALESFLRQEAKFQYEILIIDDKSTDNSTDIIKSYAAKYPDKIKAFYNSKNLGITQTWIKICKEAKGKYIARCDGDDYWIDDKKLQKQVDLLEKNKDSRWCSSDYNIVSPAGNTTQVAAVANGIIECPRSYAEMFATKGMTMASTWVVDRKLMQSINENINKSAVDYTFNIQLDLFMKTKLTYLDEVTAAFRMNEGSDSRPIDKSVARKRDERLLETQLEYLKKYESVYHEEIIRILLQKSMRNEELNREGHQRLELINRQRDHIEMLEGQMIEKEKLLRRKDVQIKEIINSKKYRVGKMVVAPGIAARKVLSRGKQS